MKYSIHKEELNKEISQLISFLISIKTKETSIMENEHWLNAFIDSLSLIKYQILDDIQECRSCGGDGADYPPYAESMSDAVACPICEGYGFLGRKELKDVLVDLKEKSSLYKNEIIINKINQLFSLPLFS